MTQPRRRGRVPMTRTRPGTSSLALGVALVLCAGGCNTGITGQLKPEQQTVLTRIPAGELCGKPEHRNAIAAGNEQLPKVEKLLDESGRLVEQNKLDAADRVMDRARVEQNKIISAEAIDIAIEAGQASKPDGGQFAKAFAANRDLLEQLAKEDWRTHELSYEEQEAANTIVRARRVDLAAALARGYQASRAGRFGEAYQQHERDIQTIAASNWNLPTAGSPLLSPLEPVLGAHVIDVAEVLRGLSVERVEATTAAALKQSRPTLDALAGTDWKSYALTIPHGQDVCAALQAVHTELSRSR